MVDVFLGHSVYIYTKVGGLTLVTSVRVLFPDRNVCIIINYY